MNNPPTALELCAREPIHIPGAIQPHGFLLTFSQDTLTCLQASANWDAAGLGPAADLAGLTPEAIFGEAQGQAFRERLDPSCLTDRILTLDLPAGRFDAALHCHDGVILAELEPAADPPGLTLHGSLQEAMASLRSASTLTDALTGLATTVSHWTGYGRVMIYQFDADWHGQVVAEHLEDASLGSYLGHHFPASDIPEQARLLYTKSWIRVIPVVDYQPAGLLPPLNPITSRPLDLSFSILRSVSPVHLEYLANMGVGASMSVSLMLGGQLWGLIACHHHSPRHVAGPVRNACALLGQIASMEIQTREERLRSQSYAAATRIQTRFFDVLAKEQNFVEALEKYTPDLLEFMEATGAVMHINGRTTMLGKTPDPQKLPRLMEWLKQQDLNPIHATQHLSGEFPDAAAWTDTACGLLAIRLSPVEFQIIVFFRPEVVTTVTWAGNPHKPYVPGQRLHPRESFASWVETVRGHSLPWTPQQQEGARELRDALNALVLRRTEHLISSNDELEKRNTDLQSFAHIASHDLKEPLRGIAQYSQYIEEDHGPNIPEEARSRIRTIHTLAVHSGHLLEALSRFSRIGRMDINPQQISGDELLDTVLVSIRTALESRPIEIRRPAPLPLINCDPVLAREVFSNLIINAAKYNQSPEPWIEITATPGERPGAGPTFHLTDNGIGIEPRHWDAIFTMFRRLHAHDAYGGGTGAGLAIARSIVERHGGRISVQSSPGIGSTFSFTFG